MCDAPAGCPGIVPRMLRLCALLTVLALALAACGGGGGGGGSSSSSSSAQSTSTGSAQSASAQGKQIFTSNCGGCHTIADAGTNGQVGPNLDDLKPAKAVVVRQVNNGGGQMPSFKGKLSDAQINAVATYVSSAAGKSS
jgi:mono/diheme cytochrome c family protein